MPVVSHYNIRRTLDIYANVQDRDLGSVARDVERIVDQNSGSLTRGNFVRMRGQVETMNSSYIGLLFGLRLRHRPRLPADRRQLPVLARSLHHHHGAARGHRRHRALPLLHAHHALACPR